MTSKSTDQNRISDLRDWHSTFTKGVRAKIQENERRAESDPRN